MCAIYNSDNNNNYLKREGFSLRHSKWDTRHSHALRSRNFNTHRFLFPSYLHWTRC
jgi:hypothetical protein